MLFYLLLNIGQSNPHKPGDHSRYVVARRGRVKKRFVNCYCEDHGCVNLTLGSLGNEDGLRPPLAFEESETIQFKWRVAWLQDTGISLAE